MIHIQEIKVQLYQILFHVIQHNHHQHIIIKKDKIIQQVMGIMMEEHMQVIMEVQHGLQLMIIGQREIQQHQQQILIMLIHQQSLHFIINIISNKKKIFCFYCTFYIQIVFVSSFFFLFLLFIFLCLAYIRISSSLIFLLLFFLCIFFAALRQIILYLHFFYSLQYSLFACFISLYFISKESVVFSHRIKRTIFFWCRYLFLSF